MGCIVLHHSLDINVAYRLLCVWRYCCIWVLFGVILLAHNLCCSVQRPRSKKSDAKRMVAQSIPHVQGRVFNEYARYGEIIAEKFKSCSQNIPSMVCTIIAQYMKDCCFVWKYRYTIPVSNGSVFVCIPQEQGRLMIATKGTKNNHSIRLVDYDTSTESDFLKGHKSSVSALVYSPRNQLLISGAANGVIRLWYMNKLSGKYKSCINILLPAQRNGIACMATSMCGSLLAAGSWDTLSVLSLPLGKMQYKDSMGYAVSYVAWNADSSQVVVCGYKSGNYRVSVLNLPTKTVIYNSCYPVADSCVYLPVHNMMLLEKSLGQFFWCSPLSGKQKAAIQLTRYYRARVMAATASESFVALLFFNEQNQRRGTVVIVDSAPLLFCRQKVVHLDFPLP